MMQGDFFRDPGERERIIAGFKKLIEKLTAEASEFEIDAKSRHIAQVRKGNEFWDKLRAAQSSVSGSPPAQK